MRKIRFIVGLLALFVGSHVVLGQAQTKVRLISDHTMVRAGASLMAGIELEMPAGWHTYWRNPSEPAGPGLRTKADWTLPKGITVSEILWPVPTQLTEPSGITQVYEGKVLLLVPVQVAAGTPSGPVELKAKVSWLECEQECVPGRVEVSVTVMIGDSDAVSANRPFFEKTLALLPATKHSQAVSARWEAEKQGEQRAVLIDWQTSAASGDFYAYESKTDEVLAKTEIVADAPAGTIRLRKLVNRTDDGWPAKLTGLLVAGPNTPERRGFEVSLPIGAALPTAVAAPEPVSLATLLPMLGAALLGGLILNIMPCVLPVIALKVLGFVRQAGSEPRRVRKLGLVYGLGVLVSFLVLALVLLAVQAATGDANWSTAFQSPVFRVTMCVLMLLVALNLFGVFEVTLGGSTMGAASELTTKEGSAGAFFNGVLATVLATPCTAPFLATAVAFAFTQPPLVLILVFLTVGVGLALPFVALCWQPAWLKLLPKPGDWMVRFKVAMGFPILGTAIWMFWFTATRMGPSGVLWFGIFLVLVAAAAWTWGEFAQRARKPLAAGVVAVALLAGGYFGLLEGVLDWRTPASQRKPKLNWQPWSKAAVAEAQKAGRPVLVDFTADNCANCKFNKLRSIDIASTIERLKAGSFATLEGDFTDADPEIAAELRKFKRRGVPLVLVYSKDPAKPPRELPTIFSPDEIHEALDWAVK
jgi:thiol:disulfide interchange protein